MNDQLVDVTCPSCGADDARCRIKGNAIAVRCTSCGRIDVRPMLLDDELDAFGDVPTREELAPVIVLHSELLAGREHEIMPLSVTLRVPKL